VAQGDAGITSRAAELGPPDEHAQRRDDWWQRERQQADAVEHLRVADVVPPHEVRDGQRNSESNDPGCKGDDQTCGKRFEPLRFGEHFLEPAKRKPSWWEEHELFLVQRYTRHHHQRSAHGNDDEPAKDVSGEFVHQLNFFRPSQTVNNTSSKVVTIKNIDIAAAKGTLPRFNA